LFVGLWSALPLLLEGAVGGAIASAVLWIVPQWRPDRGVVPSPLDRSLQRQMVTAFLAFAAAVVLLSALTAFFFSARSAERSLVEQMVDSADATAHRLGALQDELAGTLAQFGADPRLAAGDTTAKSAVLGRMQATPQFSAVRLVDSAGVVLSARAGADEDETPAELSAAEAAVAAEVMGRAEPRWLVENGDGEIT